MSYPRNLLNSRRQTIDHRLHAPLAWEGRLTLKRRGRSTFNSTPCMFRATKVKLGGTF